MPDPIAAPDWYRTAFGPLAASFWTSLMSAARVEEEARFIESALAPPRDGLLLDIPCGAGRHARVLGRAGYRVVGIDLSPHMLAAASAEGDVPGVSLRLGDMGALAEPPVFDGAYCWGNSFGYLPDEQNASFVCRVAAALKPGARFALEVGSIAEVILADFTPRTEIETDGIRFTAERRYSIEEGALHIRYRIERGAGSEEFLARATIYRVADIVRMAAAAGFETAALYGSIDGDPASMGRPLIAIFRKR